MKLVKYRPQTVIAELEINKDEAKMMWMALQELKESHPAAGRLWIEVITSAVESFHRIEERFEED